MIRKTALLLICLIMSACVSVTDTVARLDPEFVKRADNIVLKTSHIKFNPARFNQTFFGYRVDHAKQSTFSRSDANLVSSQKTIVNVDSNLIDWLIFDRPYPHDYSYEVNNQLYEIETQSHFSFDMSGAPLEPIHTRCGSFYLEHTGVTSYDGKQGVHDVDPGFSAESRERRVNTFLSCRFLQQEVSWYLSMELPAGSNARIVFAEPSDGWSIEPIHAFSQYLSDGNVIDSRELPFWKKQIAGFSVYYRGQQIGAISTIGKPQLWIQKTMPSTRRDQLASLLYALAVFNDIDSDWDLLQGRE